MLEIATLVVFPLLMAFAAISDLFTMTISNRLTLLVLALFPIFAVATGMGAGAIAVHFACGAAVLALTFFLFAMGWIGGGDAKLAAATAVWVGVEHLGDYGINSALIGGALTLLIVYLRLLPLPAFMINTAWVARLHQRGAGIPYGIALAAAGLIVYPDTGVWKAAVGA